MVFIFLLSGFIALCLFASLHCCCHISDLCQSKKFHVAALNSNNSALILLTHAHYQSNISDCQLWEMCDCLWWQFASCLSWLLCINILPSNFPRAPWLTYFPHQPRFLLLLSGLPDLVLLLLLLAVCARVPGLQLSNMGRLGDKRHSVLTLDVGRVWLLFSPVGFMSGWTGINTNVAFWGHLGQTVKDITEITLVLWHTVFVCFQTNTYLLVSAPKNITMAAHLSLHFICLQMSTWKVGYMLCQAWLN